MKHLFKLLTILLVFTACSPEQQLQDAIDGISKENSYMSSSVGFAGMKPDAYKHFETMVSLASPDKLRSLINHDSAAVRIYAFQGMVETNHPETFPAFKVLTSDKAGVSTFKGCLLSSDRIDKLAINLITNNYINSHHYQLKREERITLDSMLLCSDEIYFRAWTFAYANMAPAEQHYDLIKELAIDSNYIASWAGLANFRREADLPAFKNKINFNNNKRCREAFDIIFRFPHPAFIEDLKIAQSKLLHRQAAYYDYANLYIPVFQYSPKDIIPFLQNIDDFEDQERADKHRRGFWIAAQLHNDPPKRDLAKGIPRHLKDKEGLEWYKSLAIYAELD